MESNVEVDRLSNLPDDLIHKILSFVGMKCAIRMSSLSSRWRFVWASMPYLNLWIEDFRTMHKFCKFVTNVLSHRNNQVEVFSVKLSFRGKVIHEFVSRVVNYAFSHKVQQLTVKCLNREKSMFSPSLFSSQSLRHLSLTMVECSITPLSTWDLPALTTLHVSNVDRWDDNSDKCSGLFSMCANLKNLTFSNLHVYNAGVFSICHPRVSNLTLKNVSVSKIFDVVTPQLKNLTIKDCTIEFRISAPNLSFLHYEARSPKFSTDGFNSLENVNLCFRGLHNEGSLQKNEACRIFNMLQHFHNAKFLSLNTEIVELLSSYVELFSHQPSPFVNLKSLKIYPFDLNEELDKKVTMSTEVRNYLLDNSPSATVTMVSRKEIMAPKNAKLAQKLMEELHAALEQRKANSESKRAETQVHHMQAKTQVGNPTAQVELGGRTTEINSYWEGLRVQIEQGKRETNGILSKLSQIEALLAKLYEWQIVEMQPRFSSLCAEADPVMNDIIDCNFVRCDKKKQRINAYLREVATTSQPSA